jgi:hypothetical protein
MVVAGYPRPEEARRPTLLVRTYGRIFGRTYDPTLPTGRSMAVTVEAWKAVDGFPEDLATGEDVTFGRRVARTGRHCVLTVDAEVTWEQRSSLRATARMYYRYGAGGARSGDALVVGRDVLRAMAYAMGPLVAWRGSRAARGVVALGTAAYLSLPAARALHDERPIAVLVRLPVVLAVKDLAKAAGCVGALVRR